MDGDVIIGILMVVFWLVSSLAARFGKKKARSGEGESEDAMPSVPPVPPVPGHRPQSRPQRPAAPAAGSFQKALQNLAEQMGMEVEVAPAEAPVASEHSRTASEHRRTALETHATLSERTATASEHRRTASEARRTASETAFTLPEHQLTASEHRRGDLRRPRPTAAGMPQRRRRSEFSQRLAADLRGGQGSLARAIVLREILGPPVGLRSGEEEQP